MTHDDDLAADDAGAPAEDDALRARLRAADPARGLPPLGAEEVAGLVGRVVAEGPGGDLRDGAGDELAARRARRRPRRAVVALAGVAAAGVVAVAALTASGGLGGGSTVELAAADGAGPAVACAPVDVAALRTVGTAFEARAVEVADGRAVLEVTDVYAGDLVADGDEVVVPQADPDAGPVDGGPLPVTPGGTYLVATTPVGDGPGGAQQVAPCGLSGPDDPALRALYEEAFRAG